MAKGYLLFLLHAHLPFVRHPEHDSFLEENWLFEAISETYLPLLRALDRLENDSVPFKISLSISPTLTAMLHDDLLQKRYVRYLEQRIELASREVNRTRDDGEFAPLARMYQELYETNLRSFVDDYECKLIRGFDYFYKRGRIELLATAATHAYLPLYTQYPAAMGAQVQVGCESHARFFGKATNGFWLPECGYAPGMETYLKDQGVRYFFVATHGMVFANDRPAGGVYEPITCPNGVSVFARDHASTNAVWSADEGYPGDYRYRDFYRDIGHDLPIDYIGPFLPGDSIRSNTGFKYYAVTGKTAHKDPYDPELAKRTVDEHANNFVYNQHKRVDRIGHLMDLPPVTVCPFDAELFGHWWFEGPQWLEAVIRRISESDELEMTTPTDYLRLYPEHQVTAPSFSSWGNKGYSEVWLDGTNDWIYRHTHKAIERMCELADRFPRENGLKQRALNQAAREVLLSQASDWPFIMHSGTAVPYAVRRVKEHISNVSYVYDALSRGSVGTEWLTRVERHHNIFPDLDYRIFAAHTA